MSELREHWGLDPEFSYLNHGSFGATPKVVLRYQHHLREQMERQPVRFFVREAPGLLMEARAELARFLGASPARLAFVSNASTGVNSVLRSLPLERDDELLVTDHEYNACRNVLDFVAEQSGCDVRVVSIPFPIQHSDEIVERVVAATTPRTRLLLIDHVTSQSGLIFPIEPIIRELNSRGIDTLVDGAHAPGMIPLDLDRIGAAYYTGNCHKWICAPKGAAFLYVREDRFESVRPAIISHGANAPTTHASRFRNEFDWVGTSDITPFLCVPEAIRFLNNVVDGGIEEVRRRNRALVLEGRDRLVDALGISPPAPDDMIGHLASVPLPDRDRAEPMGPFDIDPIQDALFHDERIEVPVMPWPAPPQRILRISAQLYNHLGEYDRLAAVVQRLFDR